MRDRCIAGIELKFSQSNRKFEGRPKAVLRLMRLGNIEPNTKLLNLTRANRKQLSRFVCVLLKPRRFNRKRLVEKVRPEPFTSYCDTKYNNIILIIS